MANCVKGPTLIFFDPEEKFPQSVFQHAIPLFLVFFDFIWPIMYIKINQQYHVIPRYIIASEKLKQARIFLKILPEEAGYFNSVL